MPPENSDDNLLARLNALRPSTVSFEKPNKFDPQETDQGAHVDVESDSKSTVPHNDEDDRLLDDLLQDIGLQGEWELDRHDARDVKKLAADAHLALTSMQREQQANSKASNGSGDPKRSHISRSEDEAPAVSEEAEADEIIAKMLAEVALERNDNHGDDANPSGEATETGDDENGHREQGPSTLIDLPSAPSEAPKTSMDALDGDEDGLAARFSGLSLPGAPSFSPSKKPTKIVKSNLPTYTDDQIDSWCVICNDDATVKCIGCDGDLYCRWCWAEGHTGPDAGFDEKRHRWTKYSASKPNDSA